MVQRDCEVVELTDERAAIREASATVYDQGTKSVQSWRPELVRSSQPHALMAPSSAPTSRDLMSSLATVAAPFCVFMLVAAL